MVGLCLLPNGFDTRKTQLLSHLECILHISDMVVLCVPSGSPILLVWIRWVRLGNPLSTVCQNSKKYVSLRAYSFNGSANKAQLLQGFLFPVLKRFVLMLDNC